jgi:CheY-like chemotaxis protein
MNRTILLVEDDENDVFFFKRAAKLAGMMNPLHVAEDGRQAIDYLTGAGAYADRTRFPLPSLVLLDLKLPHIMGLDVLKWIRAQPALQTVIVIVFTSSRMAPDIDTAYRLGANSYMVKPSSPGKLQEMLVVIKQYWLDLNEPPPECMGLARRVARVIQSAIVPGDAGSRARAAVHGGELERAGW